MTVTMAALFPPFKESRMPGKLSLPRAMTGYIGAPRRYGQYSGAVARHSRHRRSAWIGVCHRVIAISQACLRLPESICKYTRCSVAEKDAARCRSTYWSKMEAVSTRHKHVYFAHSYPDMNRHADQL